MKWNVSVGSLAVGGRDSSQWSRTGIDVCPEGGAAWSALQTLPVAGAIRDQDRVVVFNTGTGLKYR